jgi:drug/metabolite transporter (DMT)-like permease
MNRWMRPMDSPTHAFRAGLALAALTATISGISVFVNATAVRSFEDPVLFTTLKNLVAGLVLAGLAIVTVRKPWRPSRGSVRGLIAIGVIGGGVPFVLFFTGLAEATAPAAAIIHKTLFLWVAVLAVLLLHERLGSLQVTAMAVLLLSQLLIQAPAGVGWGSGETLIALATALWALEVIVAKRVLVDTPAPIAAAARMGIGLGVLVGYLALTGGLHAIAQLTGEQLAWVLVTGLLLSGYVASWYAALRRASASAVTAVLTLSVPITASLQLASSGQLPGPMLVVGYALGLAAVAALAWLALRGREAALRGRETTPAVAASVPSGD